MMGQHAARPEMARPRPRTRPTAQVVRPACKPARSAPFYRRIRIDEGDRALLAPARGHPGLAPGAALLPAQPSRVQGAPDRERAHLGQSIRSPTQGSLQQAQRPRRRAVLLALGHAGPFGQNALLRISAIADPRATAMARPHGGEPLAVEAADPGRDRLGVPSSDLVSGCRVAGPVRNGQQRSSTLNLRDGRAGRAAQAGQGDPLVGGKRAQGVCLVARHGIPREHEDNPITIPKLTPSDPLAAVRDLSFLELVTETLRAALDDLAAVAPDWLRAVAKPVWFERYGRRVEDYRLPKSREEREVLALEVGADGFVLLGALDAGLTHEASLCPR